MTMRTKANPLQECLCDDVWFALHGQPAVETPDGQEALVKRLCDIETRYAQHHHEEGEPGGPESVPVLGEAVETVAAYCIERAEVHASTVKGAGTAIYLRGLAYAVRQAMRTIVHDIYLL